jgi:ketosteroid isomerase-like protein
VSDSDAIRATFSRYDAAYRARDVAAVRRVHPTLDAQQVTRLGRTFEENSKYEMDTRIGRIDVSGETASVQATIDRVVSPRVGVPQRSSSRVEFQLQRRGADWVIVKASPR